MPDAEGEPVQLFVYDLSGGMARAFSQMLLGRTIEAIYHTSIVVAGAEFYFGGGINVSQAGHTPFGRPIQVLDLGHTQLPEDVREALLADLSERYTPESYSLFSNNCNNFSDELAQLLCGNGIPQHITGLPAEVLSTPFGQMIAPMLSGLEEQMRSMRAQAYRPHIEAAAAAALAGPQAASTSAATAAVPAVEAATPADVEPAVPATGAAGRAAAAPATAAKEGAGLRSAEVEIEAAVEAGMIQEAEQALGSLELQPAAGQQPEAAAATAAGGEPSAAAAAPMAAGAASGPAASGKLSTELAVEAEYKRLVAAGMAEHEAQALALEAVAAAAGAATDNPVQHSQGAGDAPEGMARLPAPREAHAAQGADALAIEETKMIVHSAAAHNGASLLPGLGELLQHGMPLKEGVHCSVSMAADALMTEVRCSLTQLVMLDPVTAADGCNYERRAIEAWIAQQLRAGQVPRSPVTCQPLAHLTVCPNRTARMLIASLRAAGLIL
ncbi:deSI [Chlorella sorokiniana]|uniref:DeSI n=1 Tax=Chlorella sorokiniana TaxID=3076 RepID=A0A2P6TLW5_CHLSO|nr:deSI [Chlorella sorokiniana]|eukprot:PRW45331.1 deSI [Chlorella sorokiniana]